MSELTTQNKFRGGLAALVIALMFVAGYAMYQRGQANRLAAQNQQTANALHSTEQQVDALNAKFNDMLAQQQAAEAARQQAAAQEAARRAAIQRQVARHGGRRLAKDDPRWKQFQQKLDAQGQAIDATRQDLTSAKTELSGSIARTHDEVVLLQKKGERNYHEFDLSKSKQFQATGPVGIKLRKANTKHQFADLDLMVDDVNLQKKHVNLYEPVVFYASDSGVPVELVINSISKDHIRGYVSEPKYRRSDLAAMANSNAAPNPASAATDASVPQAPRERKRLELPKN